MNQTKPDKWVINVLSFVSLALVWALTGCGGDQLINAVTTATAISTTNLPQPHERLKATEPAITSLPLTATSVPVTQAALDAQEFYYKGLTYAAAGSPADALDSFDQAIALQPNYALAYLERGKLHMSQNNFAQAKSDFHHALEFTTDPMVKNEVKALLQQLVTLAAPATSSPTATPSPTTDQVTPAVTPRGVSAPPQEASLEQSFTLPLGHSIHLAEADLTLTFSSLLEDSRCPKQVNCFWAGQVRIMIEAQQGQAAATLIEMNTNPPLKQNIVNYAGYDIELIGVDPYPESPDQKIPPEDYQITFVVKKK